MTGGRALLLAIVMLTWSQARAQDDWAIEVVLAGDSARAGPSALTWLREEVLPATPDWPRGLKPLGPLCVRVTEAGVTAWASDLADDEDYLVGVLRIEDRTVLQSRCAFDGTEDWYAVAAHELRTRAGPLVSLLEPMATEPSGRIDVAALVGNLTADSRVAGPLGLLLSLGPGYCGDVTWRAWQGHRGLRVQGHSGGGLLFPAALALLASEPGETMRPTARWRILAGSARDGERAEAARQLALSSSPTAVATLRGLLHADGPSRATAIDSLVRMKSAESLAHIVAAATRDHPDTVQMARVALKSLWPRVPETERAALLAILRRHPVAELRSFDPTSAVSPPTPKASPTSGSLRARIIVGLLILSIGVFGLWWRERVRSAG